MSREGQRGRRRSNFGVARNARAPWARDSLSRGWSVPTGLIPDQEPGIRLSNTLEGGTATTAVTTGNSGGASGDAFNSVFSASGCTQTYESNGSGGLLLRMSNTASSGGSFGWDTAGEARTSLRLQFTMVSGTFTGNVYIASVRDSANTNTGFSIRMNSSLNLRFMNRNGFTFPWTGSYVLVAGTRYQIEATIDTVAGTGEVRLWDAAGTTLLDTGSITGQDFRSQALNTIRFGNEGTSLTTVGEFDDLAIAFDGALIGPVTAAGTNAPAQEATGAGTANNAAVSITVSPSEAAGTGAADNPTAVTGSSTTAVATEGAGTGAAADAAPSVAAAPAAATGTGVAGDASIKVTVSPPEAAGTGAADNAATLSTSLFAGGSAANDTAPFVTFPAGITPGMAILVMLMQNNTDVVTAVPAELFALDPITPATGTGAANLYVMITDGATAGATLTWTLSATRNWTTTWIALSDVAQDLDLTVNALDSIAATVTATTSFTAPSVTSGQDGYVIEFFGAKGDGVALTDLGTPSGFTERFQRLASTGTFGSNTAVATRDGNPAAPGTYGGDTWTTSSAVTTTFRYTVVLRQVEPLLPGVGFGEAGDATINITVYPAEAAGTGAAFFDTAGTSASLTLIAENPIYGFGEAFDATVSTAVVTNAPAGNAAGTGAAQDATVAVTEPATEATGTGTAHDAAVSITVAPAAAAGTGSAQDAVAAVAEPSAEASGAGSAGDATIRLTVYPPEAAGVGAADDPQVFTSTSGVATPTVAAGTGAAYDGAVSVTVAPAAALGTGATYDMTVTTTANAIAGELLGVGAAYDAPVLITPNADGATGAGAAFDTTLTVVASPAALTGAGAAYDGTVALTYPAGGATGVGAAGAAVVTITVYPDAAIGVGAAYELTPNPGSRSSVHGGRRPRPTVGAGSRGAAVAAGVRARPGLSSGSRGGPAVDGGTRVSSTTEGGTP